MNVISASVVSRRRWVLLGFAAAAPILGAIGLTMADVASVQSPWNVIGQLVWILPLLLLLSLLMDTLGVGTEWHFDLEGRERHQLAILLTHSALPPFGRYLVRVNGEEQAKVRGSWQKTERLEFTIGKTSAHRAQFTVYGRNLWPLRGTRIALDVDGHRLVEI